MKKKILALCLVVVLAVTAVTGATLAYFTDTADTKTNTFTVGNVEIKLDEPNWDADGSEDAPDVYPGEALAKDPIVTNMGENPCFVRVKVTGLDALKDAGAGNITLRWIDEAGVYHDGYNTRDWELIGDYYYYKKPLCVTGTESEEWNAGLTDVTTPVFSQIVIPTDLENAVDANGDGVLDAESYDVLVDAYAVQAQGARASWTQVKAMTPAEIAAWFTTCGM